MNMSQATSSQAHLIGALRSEDSSIRLKAALAAGTDPDPIFLDELVKRCAVESDFFVREMLSWALTRLPSDLVLDRLHQELHSEISQARSQALHTLSKINDRTAWSWITTDMLRDPDDEVARTAWRVAALFVPEEERKALGGELILQLGRGDRSMQLSLSRALIDLVAWR
ncbi:MAG: HEAT repeat domain-containing protein [Propionibacteriaceae bacterium]|nr:HEAT repeat domain-containing protein [Propionibacteriaceae bacterium]